MPRHRGEHRKTRYICLDTRLCQACWECVRVCRKNVFGKIDFLGHKHARIDNTANCTGCRACLQACRYKAILPLTGEVK